MKKKMMAIGLAVFLCLTMLSACGGDETGYKPKNELQKKTALKVGEIAVSVAEFDYYYYEEFHSLYETYESAGLVDFMGLDLETPFAEQEYDEGVTWEDYFQESATESLLTITVQCEKAKKEGITLTEGDRTGIEEELEDLKEYALEEGVEEDEILQSLYGKGMTVDLMRYLLEQRYLSDRYKTTVMEGYPADISEQTKYYEENWKDFSYVDYHSFIFDSELYEEELGRNPTEEEQSAYKEEQRGKAQALYEKITDAETFNEVSREYLELPADMEDEYSEEEDITYQESIYISDLDTVEEQFLADSARLPGDKALLEGDGYFEVVLFVDRYNPEGHSVDIRQIFLAFPGIEDGQQLPFDIKPEDYNHTKARAEAILEEWKAGDATEDSFSALAKEKSEDESSAGAGGMFWEVTEKDPYDPAYLEWSFAEGRKVGDTGIIETDYGFHVMYMSSINPPLWQEEVAWILNEDKYYDDFAAWKEDYPVVADDAGMAMAMSDIFAV